eukprot:NODE_4203_length_1922_cov_5.253482.p1 GENE.NODE_4203_length_1922_cov_5.253482~~NODE_4203_length_1922_cov_5.253482.p1  ORF type:complete len:314 (-),score=74.93 NODE_4203_length_1922_cov_5.253482:209-1150(-)
MDLVEMDDAGIAALQKLFETAHKAKDNWTRDRGCSLHAGRTCTCGWQHMIRNQAHVSKGFKVMKAFHNQNPNLWRRYIAKRDSIENELECRRMEPCEETHGETATLERVNSQIQGLPELRENCNEWRLFHASKKDSCELICKNNFNFSLAGSECTWKDHKYDDFGTPLYGLGAYFSEFVTKADEYACLDSGGDPVVGPFWLIVSRCIGGRPKVVTKNELSNEELQSVIGDGYYHSVIADRTKVLKKPYREMIFYDANQIYPEYLVCYKRKGPAAPPTPPPPPLTVTGSKSAPVVSFAKVRGSMMHTNSCHSSA